MLKEIHEETGFPLSSFFQGPFVPWQFWDYAVINMRDENLGTADMSMVVYLDSHMHESHGMFRGCRWDCNECVFIDLMTGEKYDENKVYGFAVA